jgi:putative membrane protein
MVAAASHARRWNTRSRQTFVVVNTNINVDVQEMTMKLLSVVATSVLCLGTSISMAQDAATNKSSTSQDTSSLSKLDTKEFVHKAAAAGQDEVKMGQLGAQKATSPEVKAFAEKMVKDHTAANKELMAAAQGKNVDVPKDADMMHKGMMEKMDHQKADQDFDHDFMQGMVKDHKKAVDLYQSAANSKDVDPEFRALAQKTLPKLQEHLKEAQDIERKVASR